MVRDGRQHTLQKNRIEKQAVSVQKTPNWAAHLPGFFGFASSFSSFYKYFFLLGCCMKELHRAEGSCLEEHTASSPRKCQVPSFRRYLCACPCSQTWVLLAGRSHWTKKDTLRWKWWCLTQPCALVAGLELCLGLVSPGAQGRWRWLWCKHHLFPQSTAGLGAVWSLAVAHSLMCSFLTMLVRDVLMCFNVFIQCIRGMFVGTVEAYW